MLAEWVTVERFSEQTGISSIEANRKCRANEWPEGVAWVYYSEKKRLINLTWWNNLWRETARAYARQQKAVSKLNSFTEVSDAANASSVSQLMQTLER